MIQKMRLWYKKIFFSPRWWCYKQSRFCLKRWKSNKKNMTEWYFSSRKRNHPSLWRKCFMHFFETIYFLWASNTLKFFLYIEYCKATVLCTRRQKIGHFWCKTANTLCKNCAWYKTQKSQQETCSNRETPQNLVAFFFTFDIFSSPPLSIILYISVHMPFFSSSSCWQ